MLHIESTQGGLALSADGSSWPTTGPLVLADIATLPDSGTVQVGPAGQIDAGALKKILTTMATGIMEAHVNMICIFLSTMFYTPYIDPTLKEAIRLMKEPLNLAPQSMEALQEKFGVIRDIHAVIKQLHNDALSGRPLDLSVLAEQIIPMLPHW